MSNNPVTALPNSVQDVRVALWSSANGLYELTTELHSVTIHESIDNPFLYGYITIFDTIQVREDLELVGQEKVEVEFSKDDTPVFLEFRLTSVEYKKEAGSVPYIICYITNKTELLNEVRTVSQSFTGLVSESISEIHRRYLDYDLDSAEKTQGSYSYVAPMVKPYDAISHLMKHAYNENNSPMFLYSNIDEYTILESLDTMMGRDPIDTFYYTPTIKTDTSEDAFTIMTKVKNKNKIYSYEVVRSIDFLEAARDGIVAAEVEKFDLSTKTIETNFFKYSDLESKQTEQEWFKKPTVGDKSITKEPGIEFPPIRANSLAFGGNTNNLNTQKTDVPMMVDAKYNERNLVQLNVSMNSHYQIRAGKNIEVYIPTVRSNHPEYGSWDPMYSGVYLCSHVAHHISLDEYRVSAILIKNKVG